MAYSSISELKVNHDEEPIRLFKSDYLEFFTHIHPAVVLLLFVPVVLYFGYLGAVELGARAGLGALVAAGVVGFLVWTLTEYLMHRFVFHYEPTHPVLKWVWYLIHGVHHEQPQCKTRLVMPPILSIPLAFFFFGLFRTVGTLVGAPLWVAPAYAGFVVGYLAYDMLHYAEHHLSMTWGILKFLKRYHLLHHFKTPDDRFGVSSPIWDVVFGTLPKDKKKG
ncbi:MAG TPA: sterol desaturase family protein [Acidobacteriota bacterium]|nr:sterol desaturase family protein [Acidobacteriota bacterium]